MRRGWNLRTTFSEVVLVWTLLIRWLVLWAQQCGEGSKVTASREVMIQTSLWGIKSDDRKKNKPLLLLVVILTHHVCLCESIQFFDFLFFMNPSPTQTWWQIIVAVIKPERAHYCQPSSAGFMPPCSSSGRIWLCVRRLNTSPVEEWITFLNHVRWNGLQVDVGKSPQTYIFYCHLSFLSISIYCASVCDGVF